MIDLHELRGMAEQVKDTYATPYDFKVLEAVDYAIAIESERDQEIEKRDETINLMRQDLDVLIRKHAALSIMLQSAESKNKLRLL